MILAVVLAVGAYWLIPKVQLALNTVSTDDAYVNGHATWVAPRVGGRVSRVHVEDNMRVRRGDVLVQIDDAPYQAQVAIKQAAVEAAERDVAAAQAQVRGLIAQVRSNRFRLEHAMEEVRHRIELLKANVAQWKLEQANLELAQQEDTRNQELFEKKALSQQQLDRSSAALEVARNRVNGADQIVQQTRAGLGLAINRDNPADVPADLDQTHSTVREALGLLYQSAVVVGFTPSTWDSTPKEAFNEFFRQDPEGNLDRIYGRIMTESPGVQQAEARLLRARKELDQSQLDLGDCQVLSEIDGVVTRRNVNPGNIVQPGQSLMVVRSLTDLWIDANFKETQLADLRIGQRVRCVVDMYGAEREFEGRITGFTMGTGSTLSLLPPQNATGNFVKVVQRLPVRIEFNDYDPGQAPLFIGLSCEPRVYIHEPLIGDDPGKGQFLQEYVLAAGAAKTKPLLPGAEHGSQ
ncbi:MAG: HlyD family secretion protein [Planctomycetaceae bacterium]